MFGNKCWFKINYKGILIRFSHRRLPTVATNKSIYPTWRGCKCSALHSLLYSERTFFLTILLNLAILQMGKGCHSVQWLIHIFTMYRHWFCVLASMPDRLSLGWDQNVYKFIPDQIHLILSCLFTLIFLRKNVFMLNGDTCIGFACYTVSFSINTYWRTTCSTYYTYTVMSAFAAHKWTDLTLISLTTLPW